MVGDPRPAALSEQPQPSASLGASATSPRLGKVWLWFTNVMTIISLGGLADALAGWRRLTADLIAVLPTFWSAVLELVLRPIVVYRRLAGSLIGWIPEGTREVLLVAFFLVLPTVFTKLRSPEKPWWTNLERRFVCSAVFVLAVVGFHEYSVGQDAVSVGLTYPLFFPGCIYVVVAFFSLLEWDEESFGWWAVAVGFCIALFFTLVVPMPWESIGRSPNAEQAYTLWGVGVLVGFLYLVKRLKSRAGSWRALFRRGR